MLPFKVAPGDYKDRAIAGREYGSFFIQGHLINLLILSSLIK